MDQSVSENRNDTIMTPKSASTMYGYFSMLVSLYPFGVFSKPHSGLCKNGIDFIITISVPITSAPPNPHEANIGTVPEKIVGFLY